MDQGSGAKIMYLDLYKGLNIRPEDLTAYDSPLVSFDRKVVIPRGQIKLSIQVGWFKSGGGGLHRGGRIFPLHSHCGQALASCLGSCLFYSVPVDEIFDGGPN